MVTAHTDVVGSLLRPPELLARARALERGELPAPEFKAIEDAAVDAAVRLAGGRRDRRRHRRGDAPPVVPERLPDAVDGFGDVPLEAYLWGEWHGDESVGDDHTQRPARLGVKEKLRRRRHIAAEELTYLRGASARRRRR